MTEWFRKYDKNKSVIFTLKKQINRITELLKVCISVLNNSCKYVAKAQSVYFTYFPGFILMLFCKKSQNLNNRSNVHLN